MPALWRPRRIALCAGLVGASILQAIGAIILSSSSAALLRSESSLAGLPVLVLFASSATTLLVVFVAQQKYVEQFALSYIHEIRMAYTRHALLVPFDVKSPGLGLSLTRLVNDLGAVKLWLSRGLLALITLVPVVATLATWLVMFEQTMVLPLVAAGLVWVAAVLMTLPGLRHSIRKSRQKRGGISLLLGRTLPHRLPLLLHGKLEPVLTRLAKRSTDTCRYLMQRAVWSALLKAGCRASFPVAVCVYALTSGFEADRIVLFLMVFSFLATQLEAGAAGIEYFQANQVAREKLMRLFSLPTLPIAPQHRTDGDATLEISRLRLPSDRVMTARIEQGKFAAILAKDARDLRHLCLSLAGLTDTSSSKHLSLGGVSFADLGCKEIWRRIALIAPENGVPAYQVRQPAVALGKRGTPNEALLESLSAALGDWRHSNSQAPEAFSEEEDRAIRIARAFLRAPGVIVVSDSTVLASRDWMKQIRDWAEQSGTTLLCLTQSVKDMPTGFLQVAGPE